MDSRLEEFLGFNKYRMNRRSHAVKFVVNHNGRAYGMVFSCITVSDKDHNMSFAGRT